MSSIWSCLWRILKSFRWYRCSSTGSYVCCRTAHVTPLFWKLQWLPVCFLVQFKVLFLTFKALYGMRLDYLRDYLFVITSACSMMAGRKSMLRIPPWELCWYKTRNPGRYIPNGEPSSGTPRAHAHQVSTHPLLDNGQIPTLHSEAAARVQDHQVSIKLVLTVNSECKMLGFLSKNIPGVLECRPSSCFLS